jgi:GNAT superfamily N-acetyltransferase
MAATGSPARLFIDRCKLACRWPAGETGCGFVDSETPELSVAVRPEYRGRGIGTLLLRRLLAEADHHW